MPLFALIGHDHPLELKRRQSHQAAHREHMAKLDAGSRLRYGGPLMNEQEEMVGSLIILEANNLDEAKIIYAEDPYIIHNVFERYEVIETKQIFPRGN